MSQYLAFFFIGLAAGIVSGSLFRIPSAVLAGLGDSHTDN